MASKKSVLITGCSDNGIGSGLALVFKQRNYHVFATARSPAKMTLLQDTPDVTLLTLDVCNQDHIAAAAEAVSKHTGGTLDCLINNAGHNHYMPILDENLDEARQLYETNVFGPVALTQAFAPSLIKARGTVVFITSIAGHLNSPYMGVYAASKRSLELIAETLRLELAPFHVQVLSIVTGAVKTMAQSHFGDFQLPDTSLYKPIEDKIAAHARGEDGRERTELMTHCRKVVEEIIRGASGKIWCGSYAGLVKFATSFVPGSYLVGSLLP
ncbi:hypothetical protein EYZ11_010216 [Aspergillus tanneri]|uniref:NADPH-dependent 1-acyldihydroxyacetone phosphate reductase n=1 Tax=Aspergillus tanneri TaxID=1220188 RepID=A0A4S3J818_9EURO|nr:hypothetical protein EYZ11_010216 [Aspergillus tanneri]